MALLAIALTASGIVVPAGHSVAVANPAPAGRTSLGAAVPRMAGSGPMAPVQGATVLATVPIGLLNFTGSQPSGMAYDSNDGDVYIADFGSDNVTIVNDTTNSILANPVTGDDPIDTAYAPNTHDVYVMNFGTTNDLSVYRGTTYLGHVPVGPHPRSGTYDGANGYLYSINYGGNNVSAVSGLSVVGSVNVGTFPQYAAYDPTNHYLYVANTGSDNVSVVAGLGVVATIAVGLQPTGILYDPANGYVYVSNSGNDTVSVIGGTSVVGTAITGQSPDFGAYDPVNGAIYMPCQGSDTVSLIQGTSTVANISVGIGPRTATFANSTGEVYVTDQQGENVTVLNGSSIVANVGTGLTPYQGIYDSGARDVFVSDYNAGNITVIGAAGGPYYVTFNETGLAAGTAWAAMLNATSYPANGTSVAMYAANGTYPYSFPSVPGYVSPRPGNVTVNGNDPVVTGRFVPAYPVDFNETGLPGGTNWGVTFNGTTQYQSNVTIEFMAPVGSYAYSIVPVPGFNTSWSGTVRVAAPRTTVDVNFTRFAFVVNVTETGLPATTPWSIDFNGSVYHAAASMAIEIPVPNGTYRYSVTPPAGFYVAPSGGSIVVAGSAQSLRLDFVPVSYPLVFMEHGLATGTNWSLVLDGSAYTVTGASFLISEPNGSYAYRPGPVAGYSGSGGGTAIVNGSGGTFFVTYTALPPPPEYWVMFTESGLAAGTSWSVTLDGTLSRSTSSSIAFERGFGNYAYVVEATGWDPVPSNGNVSVSGSNQTVSIVFSPAPVAAFTISFVETGLRSGAAWSVTIGGTTVDSTGSSIEIREANGSFDYSVGGPSGYGIPGAGTVVVAGSNVSVPLAFSASGPPTFLGLPAAEGYGLSAAIVLVIVAAALVVLRRRRPPESGSEPSPSEEPAASTTPEPVEVV